MLDRRDIVLLHDFNLRSKAGVEEIKEEGFINSLAYQNLLQSIR